MPKRGYHHGNLLQALIDAALVLIEEKGPTGFTLSEAAKQAGVTPAAVYRHYEGRSDLIAECARQGYGIFADLMEHALILGGITLDRNPNHRSKPKVAKLSESSNPVFCFLVRLFGPGRTGYNSRLTFK